MTRKRGNCDALQLEAAWCHTSLLCFLQCCAKFQVTKPIHCRIIAFFAF